MSQQIVPGASQRRPGALTPEQQQYLDIRGFLTAPSRAAMLAQAAGGMMTPQRLTAVALAAIARTPMLLQCTPASLFACLYQAQALDLEIGGPLGHAYMVPFRDRKRGIIEATFVVGWRGLAYKAMSCGAAKAISAQVVYAGDLFSLDLGSEPRLVHRPVIDAAKRGEALGAYSVATLPDGTRDFQWMPTADIEKRRRASKAPDSLMWTTYWEEGACKTVVRRHMKYLPLATVQQVETMSRIQASGDDAADAAQAIDVPAIDAGPAEESAPPPKTVDDLKRKAERDAVSTQIDIDTIRIELKEMSANAAAAEAIVRAVEAAGAKRPRDLSEEALRALHAQCCDLVAASKESEA